MCLEILDRETRATLENYQKKKKKDSLTVQHKSFHLLNTQISKVRNDIAST